MEPETIASAAPDAAMEPGVPALRASREASVAGNLRPPWVSPRGLARVVMGCVIASTLVSWLALGVHLAHVIQLRAVLAAAGGDAKRLGTTALVLTAAQIVQFAVYAVTAALFLAWLYRLRVNVRAFGMRKLVYSRQWSVLGFFVPLLNVVRPFQVIGEIWRASDPARLDPFEWKSLEPPPLLSLWWGAVVVAVMLQIAAAGMVLTAGVGAFESMVASLASIFADLVSALAATLSWFLVARLTAEQLAKRERLRLEAPQS